MKNQLNNITLKEMSTHYQKFVDVELKIKEICNDIADMDTKNLFVFSDRESVHYILIDEGLTQYTEYDDTLSLLLEKSGKVILSTSGIKHAVEYLVQQHPNTKMVDSYNFTDYTVNLQFN